VLGAALVTNGPKATLVVLAAKVRFEPSAHFFCVATNVGYRGGDKSVAKSVEILPTVCDRWFSNEFGVGAYVVKNHRLRADHKYRFFRAFRTWLRTVVNAYS
jgi:hypothetical protein